MSLLGKPDHWAITDPERTMNLSIYVDHITSFDHVKNIHAPFNQKKKKISKHKQLKWHHSCKLQLGKNAIALF